MARLNRYLLTQHPLIWNMRLHWVSPVLLGLHALFYIAGLAEPQRLTSLNYSTTNFQPVASSLAVLIGLLAVIGWLVFYLRNNAFKSFYPLRRGLLLAEFFASFLVIGAASTLSLTHQLGCFQSLAAVTRDVDVVKEANTVALAYHFLPFNGSQFESYSSCDSQRAREKEYGIVDNGESIPSQTSPPPERADYSAPDSTVERSYLHYCNEPSLHYFVPASLDRYGADSVAKRWMRGGQRQAVRDAVTSYLALVRKYGGSARFDVDAQVEEVFATPRFLVRRSSIPPYNEAPGQFQEYITASSTQDAIIAITEIRKGVLTSDLVLVYLYWTLAATLLLFTFRITRLRTWFGAVIGVGIWMVIFAVLAALTRGKEDVLMPAFFVIVIASLIFTGMNVATRRRKAVAGFTFLWAVWSLPATGLAVIYYIRSLVRRTEYRYDAAGNLLSYEPSLLAGWIDAHGEEIAFANLAVVLILVALYVIPQARRWQAAPEE